jgi:hypothetical protein
MNMLEKAARAAALAELDDETRAVVDATAWPVFDSHYDIARAVLAAIREPDEAMYAAANDDLVPAFDAKAAWLSMIDAILEGESK